MPIYVIGEFYNNGRIVHIVRANSRRTAVKISKEKFGCNSQLGYIRNLKTQGKDEYLFSDGYVG